VRVWFERVDEGLCGRFPGWQEVESVGGPRDLQRVKINSANTSADHGMGEDSGSVKQSEAY